MVSGYIYKIVEKLGKTCEQEQYSFNIYFILPENKLEEIIVLPIESETKIMQRELLHTDSTVSGTAD